MSGRLTFVKKCHMTRPLIEIGQKTQDAKPIKPPPLPPHSLTNEIVYIFLRCHHCPSPEERNFTKKKNLAK